MREEYEPILKIKRKKKKINKETFFETKKK